MSKTAVYHLEYPLARPPARLGFRQHFNTGAVAMPVIMQMTVFREGLTTGTLIPVPEGEQAEHVAFDWSQTPGPATSAAGERSAPAKPAALDATEAFVYIQNDEVRVEILMPLPTLETWQAVPRNNKDVLEIAEQTAARAALEALFTTHNELKIDGVAVRPKLDRLRLLRHRFQRPCRTSRSEASCRRDRAGRRDPDVFDQGRAASRRVEVDALQRQGPGSSRGRFRLRQGLPLLVHAATADVRLGQPRRAAAAEDRLRPRRAKRCRRRRPAPPWPRRCCATSIAASTIAANPISTTRWPRASPATC